MMLIRKDRQSFKQHAVNSHLPRVVNALSLELGFGLEKETHSFNVLVGCKKKSEWQIYDANSNWPI